MPFYEFKCNNCGQRFVKLCPVGENGEKLSCPECGAPKPGRVMSGFSSPGTKQAGGSSCGGCTSTSCSGCGH